MDLDGLGRIFARNCDVKRIEGPVADAFLDANHRMGSAASRYRYGLFTRRSTGAGEETLPGGTLVAVATFSSARRWLKESGPVRSCEWVRYASLKNYRVVGGMGKLLDAFAREVRPDDVMTYAEPDSINGGRSYEKLGFESEGTVSKPGFTCLKYRKKY